MEARTTLAGLRDRINIKLDMRFRFKQLLTGQATLIIKKMTRKLCVLPRLRVRITTNPDNCNDVITHLDPVILGCDVKWALRSITTNKASGGDGIPFKLFQILKDDVVKVLQSVCQQTENSAVATALGKVSFHSNSKERQCQRMFKLPHNCTHLTY